VKRHKVTFLGAGQPPAGTPDPRYARGIDVDMSRGAPEKCAVDLPYPAPACGSYLIECQVCGLRVGVTAAGRADDPRRVTIACKLSPPPMERRH
jgi:hypothetical protein